MSEDFGSSGGSWGDDDGGGGYTETSTQSWFERIGNAIVGVLIGLVLMLVSFVLLFWNEGRAVNTAIALEEAGSNVVTVASDKIDTANEAKLVHTTGNLATEDTLTDDQFGVQAKETIQLARLVEMYQWKENVKEKTEKQIGGSTKTTKTYTYEKLWGDHAINSSGFKEGNHNNPPWPASASSKTFTATKVTLGAFTLSANLIGKIGHAEALNLTDEDAKKLPEAVKKEFRAESGVFYKGKGSTADPAIGDIKVRYTVTKPRQVSVIAEQTQNTFRAFQPKRSSDKIELLSDGNKSAKEMVMEAEAANTAMTWILRLVGFILMAVGIFLIFNPFVVFADVLPFLGSFASVVLGIVAMLASCMLSLVTIAIGWIFYRPLFAIPVLLVAGIGFVAVIVGLIRLGRRKPKPPEVKKKRKS